MHPIKTLCAPLCLLACTAAFGKFAMAKSAPGDIDALVQDAARKVMQQHSIPGLAIAVSAQGEQRFYNFGLASKETGQAVSRDTLFEIGSISKTLTATLATYAQAKGQLSLDDNPGQYLPPLRGSKLDQVTLINLGTHTAGGFPLQLPEAVQNDQQLLDYFRAWQPQFAPGSQRTYANPSIGLLGVITAKSMNMPFEAAMQTQLFPKLGMHASYIQVPPDKMPLYAQGYNKMDEPVRLNPGVLAAEAYGVKTSAKDLLGFIEHNLNRSAADAALKRALSDTQRGYYTLGAMTQDLIWEQYELPVKLETLLQGNANQMIYQSNAVTALNPPLPPQENVWVNKTGSTNGFGAYVAFVPAKKLGIVLLANKNYPIASRVQLAYRILSGLDCCVSAPN